MTFLFLKRFQIGVLCLLGLTMLSGCKDDAQDKCDLRVKMVPAGENMNVGPNGVTLPGGKEMPFNLQVQGGTPPYELSKLTGFNSASTSQLNLNQGGGQIRGTLPNPKSKEPVSMNVGATVTDAKGCSANGASAVNVVSSEVGSGNGLFDLSGLGKQQGPLSGGIVPDAGAETAKADSSATRRPAGNEKTETPAVVNPAPAVGAGHDTPKGQT